MKRMNKYLILLVIGLTMVYACNNTKNTRETIINNEDSYWHTSFITNTSENSIQDSKPDLNYYWTMNGKLKRNQGGYDSRPLHGICSVYDDEHHLIAKGRFRLGLKHGLWKYWNADGYLLKQERYHKGLLNNETVIYKPGNQFAMKRLSFKNNELHGYNISFFENGSMRMKTKYVHGKKDGLEIKYNSKEEIIEKKKYKNGALHGKTFEYRKDTTIVTKYKNGEKQPIDTSKNKVTTFIKDIFKKQPTDSTEKK